MQSLQFHLDQALPPTWRSPVRLDNRGLEKKSQDTIRCVPPGLTGLVNLAAMALSDEGSPSPTFPTIALAAMPYEANP